VVSFAVGNDGRVQSDTVEMDSHTGDRRNAQQAFEVARRAIIRCSLESDFAPGQTTLAFDPDDQGGMSITEINAHQPSSVQVGPPPIDFTPEAQAALQLGIAVQCRDQLEQPDLYPLALARVVELERDFPPG